MRILTIHNSYKIRGGEDESCDAEDSLLAERGHEVRRVAFDNAGIDGLQAIATGFRATWSRTAYSLVCRELDAWKPHVVNVQNFFPVASPSVHYAAARAGAAVVQTLHNYRLVCPGALLLRDGKVCETCLGKKVPWPGVIHGCYRGSSSATAAVATMCAVHNVLGTWRRIVSLFVALTEFARKKFVEGGIPADRIVVKPNFVQDDPGTGEGDGDYVVFVGRLSEEKGIKVLLEAWRRIGNAGRLVIIGDGPLTGLVREEASRCGSITYLGRQRLQEVYEYVGRARALVCPSICYEGLPRSIIEALCRGTPVIASGLGSLLELVSDQVTGWLVAPGDAEVLACHIIQALTNTDAQTTMRAAARAAFELRYTKERNGELLAQIYERAIREAAAVRCSN
jgi:glycosyltransferase involved in cell wall biosynthesis